VTEPTAGDELDMLVDASITSTTSEKTSLGGQDSFSDTGR
jgi:hypothetical protein